MKTKIVKLSDIQKNEKLSLSPKDYIGKKMIDPPSGWMFGFPKEIPEDVTDINAWLIENGYPKKLIETFNNEVPYRVWYEV